MLKNNMGWLMSPYTDESKKLENSGQVCYLRLEDDIFVSVGICYLKNHNKKAYIQAFREYIQQLCEKESIHELD